jgi:hypothetical protein
MKIDTRTFKFAGSSAGPDGSYKARFANDPDARPKVMIKAGHTNFVLVPLPEPMTKLEAIAYLLEAKAEGVNLDSLTSKAAYINGQVAKLNGTVTTGKKRGRPAKNVVASVQNEPDASSTVTPETSEPQSIVKTIVNTARGNSIRAKAAQVAGKVAAAKK